MNLALLVLASLVAAGGGVGGHILDTEGAPVPSARVFMEPGIAGALIEAEVDAEGRFQFAEIPVGPLGFFAHANGYAFGGQHLNLSVGETSAPLRIVLQKPGSISLSVKNSNGDKVEGARVTRLALLGDKVGIPLSKLKAFGFDEPATDKRGVCTVNALPASGNVALKIGHPDYAQEGVENAAVGGKADVTLYRGVIIEGAVIQSSSQASVSQAAVLIRNAQPPYDTAVLQSDPFGSFVLRLKPGVYLAQALGAGQSSPGWQELVVTGEMNIEKCRLTLVGTGVITGKLMDAVNATPVEGARITLETNGNMAAVERTGPTGEFRFFAGQGNNVVTYAATPGYLAPEVRNVALELNAGETIALPDTWLAPVPPYRLEVVDAEMNPVPYARVQLLRPRQFGWQTADVNGLLNIKLSNLQGSGQVVGFAEDPRNPKAALFQLGQGDAESAKVQVLPFGVLKGKVLGERSKPISGATLGGIFPGEDVDNSLLLWRVLSDKNGAFTWPVLVPGFPQLCVARTGDGEITASKMLKGDIAEGGQLDIGEFVIEKGTSSPSSAGDKIEWAAGGLLCGQALTNEQLGMPKILIYVSSQQLAYVLETLQKDAALYANKGWAVVVLTEDAATCTSEVLPVYKGKAPSAAQTFLLDGTDRVHMETFDLPPLSLLDSVKKP